MNPVLVAGTDSYAADGRVDWYVPQSPFAQFLAGQGVSPMCQQVGEPFIWSTDLDGVPILGRKNHVQWVAGGAALRYFIDYQQKSLVRNAVIAHSHGLQVALYAAAAGLKIATLISVGSPVRQDMMAVAKAARPNIDRWLHLYSDQTDRFQWFGELFDGNWRAWLPGGQPRIVRKHPLADVNDFVAGVGHSELLRDPAQFHYWIDRGWTIWLK